MDRYNSRQDTGSSKRSRIEEARSDSDTEMHDAARDTSGYGKGREDAPVSEQGIDARTQQYYDKKTAHEKLEILAKALTWSSGNTGFNILEYMAVQDNRPTQTEFNSWKKKSEHYEHLRRDERKSLDKQMKQYLKDS